MMPIARRRPLSGCAQLVEQERVLTIFGIIGTPTSASVQRYLNERKVPQLFIQSGAPRFANPKE
jgi:branched-chain amino acid transport system substrate-binding protein